MTQVLHRSPQPAVTGYIVRGGTIPPLGSSEEVLGRFGTEGEARQAFLDLRLSPAYRHGWAELMAVGEGRTPVPLCWFGDRSPSGAPGSPPHHKRPLAMQSRAVLVDNQNGTMQTKEHERIVVPATSSERPRPGRRSQVVAALVAVLVAVTLAVAAAGNRGEDTPSNHPVSTWQAVPAQPTDLPYDGSPADR